MPTGHSATGRQKRQLGWDDASPAGDGPFIPWLKPRGFLAPIL